MINWAKSSLTSKKAKSEGDRTPTDGESDDPTESLAEVVTRGVDLVKRAALSVCIEAFCASVGTFIYPGSGTFVCQLAGSVLAWL